MSFISELEKLISKVFNHPEQIAKTANDAMATAKAAVSAVQVETAHLEQQVATAAGAANVVASILKTNGVAAEAVEGVAKAVTSVINASAAKHATGSKA